MNINTSGRFYFWAEALQARTGFATFSFALCWYPAELQTVAAPPAWVTGRAQQTAEPAADPGQVGSMSKKHTFVG